MTVPRRHHRAKVGHQRSTKDSGHVGDCHGRARSGEECIPGAWSRRRGRVALRKRLRRIQVLEFFGQLPSFVVAMEADLPPGGSLALM